MPVSAEPVAPTNENLLCVNFQYGVTNDANLTASEIFNEENNTLKSGLETATSTVVINILNETYPMVLTSPLQQQAQLPRTYRVDYSKLRPYKFRYPYGGRRLSAVTEATERAVLTLIGENSNSRDKFHAIMQELTYEPTHSTGTRRLSPSQPLPSFRGRRRLVYYTDDIPVEINWIVDNPVCPSNNPVMQCAIVSSTVCVILQDGDDPAMVRQVLIDGIREAIANGEFEAAIPNDSVSV